MSSTPNVVHMSDPRMATIKKQMVDRMGSLFCGRLGCVAKPEWQVHYALHKGEKLYAMFCQLHASDTCKKMGFEMPNLPAEVN